MSVRLNITTDEAVYARLKKQVRPKKVSAFINEAVRPDRPTLDAVYKAAGKERWRRRLADDWSRTDTEGWPEVPGLQLPRDPLIGHVEALGHPDGPYER